MPSTASMMKHVPIGTHITITNPKCGTTQTMNDSKHQLEQTEHTAPNTATRRTHIILDKRTPNSTELQQMSPVTGKKSRIYYSSIGRLVMRPSAAPTSCFDKTGGSSSPARGTRRSQQMTSRICWNKSPPASQQTTSVSNISALARLHPDIIKHNTKLVPMMEHKVISLTCIPITILQSIYPLNYNIL